MARKVVVRIVDDIDGTTPATETVTFGVDGALYEIDLSDRNAAKLRASFDQWVPHARKTGRTAKSTSRNTPAPAKPTRNRGDLTAIRIWAAENGHKVSARGRIAAEIVDAYNQAVA
ncbi:Lsr2 family protein [Nocardia farcinica]|uniref:histone-like nucleoid-structuring protein Lsr2 n=1 Tax=Nocardia TaxID=1817 RepID=UPI00189353A6|nr:MULTISPECIES: Lsr2 family protein [Nocardia]MBF6289968.1 Lsr2 family protein [Nocardia cyriacigeorgica]MBF6422264.1 Lsr2 family protein [Nocardia farcinica]MBF6433920.1 Lsr2 family protein [Nocardia farcinica]MBF6504988.1 Lsr2 family protein [Nocardia farcinica]